MHVYDNLTRQVSIALTEYAIGTYHRLTVASKI